MRRSSIVIAGILILSAIGLAMYLTSAGSPEDDAEKQIQAVTRIIQSEVTYAAIRDPDVPDLPFDDNPDPAQCGIPIEWGGGQAWLTGIWEGNLIETDVLLYDSHLRVHIVGRAPHGTEVEVLLFQQNPTLDYYFVTIPGAVPQKGWVPSPFLSFDPVV